MTHFKSADNKHSVQWLAERINCNRRNIYDIFQRPSIDTELLMRIGKALGHDFFGVSGFFRWAGKVSGV